MLEKLREELEEVLDEEFPKCKSKERGHAFVLFTLMWIEIEKLEKKRKYYETKFKQCKE